MFMPQLTPQFTHVMKVFGPAAFSHGADPFSDGKLKYPLYPFLLSKEPKTVVSALKLLRGYHRTLFTPVTPLTQ